MTTIKNIPLNLIEIDSVMNNILGGNTICFVSDMGKLSKLTKLKKLKNSILNNEIQEYISVNKIKLYTPPNERKLKKYRYKYTIKEGRNIVAASILAKQKYIICKVYE
jgi:hypothetical protein